MPASLPPQHQLSQQATMQTANGEPLRQQTFVGPFSDTPKGPNISDTDLFSGLEAQAKKIREEQKRLENAPSSVFGLRTSV
jgi:hypothetical protein